jgi:hypothetical protein
MSFRIYVRPSILIVAPTPSSFKRDISYTKKATRTEEGQLSPNARRKLRNAIRWLIASSQVSWKVNMATLTFHENMTNDKLARTILSRWLEVAKYRWDMTDYVWKAEPQERGAIHFHLSTNIYIPHAELRFTWNRELRKHKLNNINDNSTDVHAISDIQSHENYLTDYMLNDEKHEGRRAIKGRLWGCSHGLSQAGKEYIAIDDDEANELQKDLWKKSLYQKLLSENKTIPDFLKFTDVYLTGTNYYKSLPECGIKSLYFDEIKKLKQHKRQKEFW